MEDAFVAARRDLASMRRTALTPAGKRSGQNRKIIGRSLSRCSQAARLAGSLIPHTKCIAQEPHPDVIESGGAKSVPSIKSHHNVGGLPGTLGLKLPRTLRGIVKDEVRVRGSALAADMVHPSLPGPGLGV
jgi:GMP synthase (glutamine-hydrolysing)